VQAGNIFRTQIWNRFMKKKKKGLSVEFKLETKTAKLILCEEIQKFNVAAIEKFVECKNKGRITTDTPPPPPKKK
jgi:hypothetical protein